MIKPFNENQLDLFLKKWFSSQPSSLVETKSWLKKNERINISARNPLVAALLCSLFHIGAEMPTTEVELYERRFDLLLGKWEQAKGVRRLPASIRKRYWQFITELAFDLHVLKIRTTSVSEACDTAERFFYSKYHRKPYDMVLDCVQRGVLEFDVHGKLSFGHFTNQEFLVGRWLVIENNLDFILEKIEDIWWYNAIKFYSASKEDISSLIRHAIISGKNDYIIADNLLELSKIAPMTDNNALSDLQM
jgi:hypothetical protein